MFGYDIGEPYGCRLRQKQQEEEEKQVSPYINKGSNYASSVNLSVVKGKWNIRRRDNEKS